MHSQNLLTPELQQELIGFARSLIRIKSFSGQEEEVIQFTAQKMKALGFDEVIIDRMGNVVGRIGNGERAILFDSHMDTVAVNDEGQWAHPPFGADLVDGRIYGRGSVDMKSGAAASIYAAVMARKLAYDSGKTIYVSCSVLEEECDGENLKHMFTQLEIQPHYVVICEPSDNRIVLGHKGKAQIAIRTRGVSAHSSAPEKGVNPVYGMAEIIQRIERANAEYMREEGFKRTLAISRISSTSASINAVPSECEVYLDRRMIPGETKDGVRQEMDRLVEGKNAAWQVGTLVRKSWTGMKVHYEPFHPAWQIDLRHPLAQACIAAYKESFGCQPAGYDFWDFSTNAVTPVSMGIPTIGFGPGDKKLAHMRDESCPVQQIMDAFVFYARLIQQI